MTTSEGCPRADLAGYSLILLDDVGQLTMEAMQPAREGDPVVIRITAFRDGTAATQILAMLPDTDGCRAFADRVAAVGVSPRVEPSASGAVRASVHATADHLRARVALPGENGRDSIALRVRSVEGRTANDVVISLSDTPANRGLAARVVRAIEGSEPERG